MSETTKKQESVDTSKQVSADMVLPVPTSGESLYNFTDGKKDADIKILEDLDKEIKKGLRSVKTAALKIGYALYKIDVDGLYKYEGYRSISHFAEERYQLSRTSTSIYLNIYKKFGITKQKNSGTPVLQDKYNEFSYSQLAEMVSIKDDSLLDEIKPDMSVRQIKEKKKAAQQKDMEILESEEVISEDGSSVYKTVPLSDEHGDEKILELDSLDFMTEEKKRILKEALTNFKTENPGLKPKITLHLVW